MPAVQGFKPGHIYLMGSRVAHLTRQRVRCFFAVDIEDRDILEKIAEAQERLKETGAVLKPVGLENIHITIRFIGEAPQELVDEMALEADEVEFAPFKVELSGVGVFPSLARINVVWAGIGEGKLELLSLFQSLEPRLRRLGLKPDKRGFRPHLTIARVKSSRNVKKLAEAVRKMADTHFGAFDVTNFRLKKSTLTPKGPIYTTIKQFDALNSKAD